MILRTVQGSFFGLILLVVIGNSVECSYKSLEGAYGHARHVEHPDVVIRTYVVTDFSPYLPLKFKGFDTEDRSEVSYFHLFKHCEISWEAGATVKLHTRYVDDFKGRLVPVLDEPLNDMCGK